MRIPDPARSRSDGYSYASRERESDPLVHRRLTGASIGSVADLLYA